MNSFEKEDNRKLKFINKDNSIYDKIENSFSDDSDSDSDGDLDDDLNNVNNYNCDLEILYV